MELADVKILILEDQELIAENLRRTLVKLGVEKVYIATNANAAEDILSSNSIGLMLVDINLGEDMKSGTDLMLELMKTNPIPHIYITANADDKNIKAASLTAPEGFLEKPYTKESVNACISIAVHKISKQRVTIKLNNKKILLNIHEILYIESDNNYINIVLGNGKILVERISLKEFITKLTPNFLQIHKSYGINMEKVNHYTGSYVRIDAIDIPIGRNYKNGFKDKIKNYLL